MRYDQWPPMVKFSEKSSNLKVKDGRSNIDVAIEKSHHKKHTYDI
jgi:hypothetical protein